MGPGKLLEPLAFCDILEIKSAPPFNSAECRVPEGKIINDNFPSLSPLTGIFKADGPGLFDRLGKREHDQE